MWRNLQVALGKDAATAGDDSDWLFIRHTYITSLIAVIMQQQLLGHRRLRHLVVDEDSSVTAKVIERSRRVLRGEAVRQDCVVIWCKGYEEHRCNGDPVMSSGYSERSSTQHTGK